MKKRFSLPSSIDSEISGTIDLVRNNIGTLNYKIVPISAIEFDPNNPRELSIERDDLPNGPIRDDPLYEKKLEEFESLKQISETIKKYGVRNAVEIYKFGTGYRLIHGERRCLGSILAGKTDILAKILDEKPSSFDIKLLQLIENIQREDLTLHETLNNIKQVIVEYRKNIQEEFALSVEFLEGLINRSKSQCNNLLSVLNADEELNELIKVGKIKSLEKAALIARSKKTESYNSLLKKCLDGASLKQLQIESAMSKKIKKLETIDTFKEPSKKPGRKAEKISLGYTTKKAVVMKLIKLVSSDPQYFKVQHLLKDMSFDDFHSCSNAFVSLIKVMETIEKN